MTTEQLVGSLRQQIETLQALQADHDEVRKERDSLRQQMAAAAAAATATAAKSGKDEQSSRRGPRSPSSVRRDSMLIGLLSDSCD